MADVTALAAIFPAITASVAKAVESTTPVPKSVDWLIAPAAILPDITESAASFADVTCKAPRCIVSILPETNSEESIELAAKCEASKEPATILSAVTELVAIFALEIALFAISPVAIVPSKIWSVVTCPSSMCLVRILLEAILVPSIALAATSDLLLLRIF